MEILRVSIVCLFFVALLGESLLGCRRETAQPTPTSATQNGESEAKRMAHQVKAVLDETTLEQMMVQFPQPPSEQSRNGDSRVITWSFSDGSKIIATFKPRGGEGSGQGLVLYCVEIK